MYYLLTNLRIKSNSLKIKKTKPIYNKFPNIKDIIIDTHVVKHIIQPNNFKKKFIKKFEFPDLFINKKSM
jgi:hypothetical protein